jgi:hypothetical protein
MSEAGERAKSKGVPASGYAVHPYYYQQYYMAQQMANSGYVPVMANTAQNQPQGSSGQYAWPLYATGYPSGVQVVQGMNGAVPAYYFPYAHPSYVAQYQAQYGYQQATSAAMTNNSSTSANVAVTEDSAATVVTDTANAINGQTAEAHAPPSPPATLPITSRSISRVSDTPSVSRTTTLNRTSSCEGMEPLPLTRKVSKSFSVEKSKWRLSRTGSKPSLAIDGTGGDEDEDWNLPASPLMGRRTSLSVSPRPCGTAFLPDDDGRSDAIQASRVTPRSFTASDIHLIDAIRMFSKEMEMPIDSKFAERLEMLENAATVQMSVLSQDIIFGDVLGLENPVNSKICYLNSVIQILLPVCPLSQVFSLALSHGSAGPWTDAIARAMRLFFQPRMGVSPSLLNVKGMGAVLKELGGLGNQQDVAEALGIVLNKLHEEWKHVLRIQPWAKISNRESLHGLDEDSFIYKLFRGIRCLGKQFEIFTQLHLAPPTSGGNRLTELLAQTFKHELHYLPPVLCIELSRHLSENQLTTSQTSVGFSGTMTIPEACCTKECNRDRTYQLVGAVVRSGVYANSGHFWAAQRRGNKWFWINDTEVIECDVSEADQIDMSSDLLSKKLDAASNWCVLVYADMNAKVAVHPYN